MGCLGFRRHMPLKVRLLAEMEEGVGGYLGATQVYRDYTRFV